MRKHWVYMLAMLLAVALTAFGAVAEPAEDAEISVEEDAPDILSEEIEISGDALETTDDALDLEMPGNADILLNDLELSEPVDDAVTGEPAFAANEEAQIAPVTEEPMMADASDFRIDENGVLVRYTGSGGDVVIPDGVTGIGRSAFINRNNITSITIPDGVTNIGDYAFKYCRSLTSITIPDSVTSIGISAFNYCTSLTSITIPDSVTSIGIYAFRDCTSLTSITIPDSVTSIGRYAFDYCTSLTSITIPDSVTSIGIYAFSGCTSLTSITIPDSVTSIGSYAFWGCTSLKTVTFQEITKIGAWAFARCSNLENVSVPSGLKSIGANAFSGCPKVNMTIRATATTIGRRAFQNVDALSITVESGVKIIDQYAFYGCKSARTITLPDTVTEIREGAFEQCGMTAFTVPKSVKKIGVAAFFDCRSMRTVTFCSAATSIGREAFFGCRKLTIHGPSGSGAETYAKANDVPFKATTSPKVSLSKCKITVKDQTYTGKALTPAPVVKYGGKTLKKGTDYTVSYANNRAVGTATVTLVGKGNYTGAVKKTFRINPGAVKLSSVTGGEGTITVEWNKGSGITGYQIQYGLEKDFSDAKMAIISKAATVKTVIKNLASKKIYYVRIRACKKIDTKLYVSAWSAIKAVRVK